MLSIPDMAIIGALALVFFGPDQLPKVARKAGQLMRDVQNTSQSFLREMERAADDEVPRAHDRPRAYDTGVAGYDEPLGGYEPYNAATDLPHNEDPVEDEHEHAAEHDVAAAPHAAEATASHGADTAQQQQTPKAVDSQGEQTEMNLDSPGSTAHPEAPRSTPG